MEYQYWINASAGFSHGYSVNLLTEGAAEQRSLNCSRDSDTAAVLPVVIISLCQCCVAVLQVLSSLQTVVIDCV